MAGSVQRNRRKRIPNRSSPRIVPMLETRSFRSAIGGAGSRGPPAATIASWEGWAVGGPEVEAGVGVGSFAVGLGAADAWGLDGGFVGPAVRRGVGAGVATAAGVAIGIGVVTGFGVGFGAGATTITWGGLTVVSFAWRLPAPAPLDASKR
jgi:hypothetical protein